jgi:hypothetical protein
VKLRKEHAKIRNFGVWFASGLLSAVTIILVLYVANLAYIRFIATANSLNEITLDDTVSDVVFLLGEPDKIGTWKDFDQYTYDESYDSGAFYVFFDEDKVERLHRHCFTSSVIGVSCRQDVKGVIELLGQPQSISISKDKTERIYNYSDKNLSIFLEKGTVTKFSIAKGSVLNFVQNND